MYILMINFINSVYILFNKISLLIKKNKKKKKKKKKKTKKKKLTYI